MSRFWVLVLVVGCADTEPLGAGVVLQEDPIALDDAGPLGFSAADVIDHVGARTYAGAESVAYDDPGSAERSDLLQAEAPFVISALRDAKAFLRQTDTGTVLWIEGTVDISSTSFATTGRMMLEAAALSDDAIHWAAETSLDGATGAMPTWVRAGVGDAFDETSCADTNVEADDAFVWLVADGPVAGPRLLVGATWEPPFADCGATSTVAGVDLSSARAAPRDLLP